MVKEELLSALVKLPPIPSFNKRTPPGYCCLRLEIVEAHHGFSIIACADGPENCQISVSDISCDIFPRWYTWKNPNVDKPI